MRLTHPFAGVPPPLPAAERLLAGLTPEQAQAVTHGAGPLLLLAGPGAGKTRTLTHRAAYLLATGRARPEEILAVTFSVRAAGELRLRLAELLGEAVARGVTAATFHSVCARLLREHAQRVRAHRALHDLRPGRHAPRDRLAAVGRRPPAIQRALGDHGQPAIAEVLARDLARQEPAALARELRALRVASRRAADRRRLAGERGRAAALERVGLRRPARVRASGCWQSTRTG